MQSNVLGSMSCRAMVPLVFQIYFVLLNFQIYFVPLLSKRRTVRIDFIHFIADAHGWKYLFLILCFPGRKAVVDL